MNYDNSEPSEFYDLEAFMRYVRAHFPEAFVGEDENDQLIIYTNMFLDPASQAVCLIPEEARPLDQRTSGPKAADAKE